MARKLILKEFKCHDPPILAFFVLLVLFILRFSLLFCAFLLFSKDVRGSADRKENPCFLGGSSLFWPKNQGQGV